MKVKHYLTDGTAIDLIAKHSLTDDIVVDLRFKIDIAFNRDTGNTLYAAPAVGINDPAMAIAMTTDGDDLYIGSLSDGLTEWQDLNDKPGKDGQVWQAALKKFELLGDDPQIAAIWAGELFMIAQGIEV